MTCSIQGSPGLLNTTDDMDIGELDRRELLRIGQLLFVEEQRIREQAEWIHEIQQRGLSTEDAKFLLQEMMRFAETLAYRRERICGRLHVESPKSVHGS